MVDIWISGRIFKSTTYTAALGNQGVVGMKRHIGFLLLLFLAVVLASLLVEAGAIMLYGHVFPHPLPVGSN
jgi:hypothetical protein